MPATNLSIAERRARWIYEMCSLHGGTPFRPWDDMRDELKEAIVRSANRGCGDEVHISFHDSWVDEKLRDGWRWGRIFSLEDKTDPGLEKDLEIPQEMWGNQQTFSDFCQAAKQRFNKE